MSQMSIFLTGATGYVGSVVAQKLQESGHKVIGLARNDTAIAKLQEHNIEPYLGDLSEPENLIRIAREVDGVIHTAFNHDFSNFAKAVQIERNIVAAFTDALEDSGKPLITSQGTAYLGDTGNLLANEETPYSTASDFSVFAMRAKAEQEALGAAQRGIRSIALRLPHFVYGRAGSVFVPFLLQAARQTGVAHYIGAGENKLVVINM